MPCYFPFYKDTIPLPCGKCPYCLNRRANNWIFRCMQESKVSDSAIWVTLTYEAPPLDENNMMSLNKNDCQKFFKRLRKIKRLHSDRPIKYYLCGEYGDTYERPHYHAIIFNSTEEDIRSAWETFSSPEDEDSRTLGKCYFDKVNENTIAYTVKYMNKGKLIPKFKTDKRLPEFQLFSKQLGINFVTNATRTFYNSDPRRNNVTVNGHNKALPRYFANKLIVCPVFRLAKRLYIQDKADLQTSKHRKEFEENPTYHQTFESFILSKKNHALKIFREKLANRKKFK